MNKRDENLLEKILKELVKMGDNYTLPYFTLGQKKKTTNIGNENHIWL